MGKKSGLRRGEGNVERHGASFRVRYVDIDGAVRRKGGFPSEQAARAWLVSRDAGSREPVAVTVRVVVEDYLRRGARDWRPGTVATYRQRADAHLLPLLGKVPLAKLTTPMVQAWVDNLVASGLAPATVQPTVAVLSGALKDAVRLGLVERNVCQGVKLPTIRRPRREVWTPDEARAVLAVAAADARWAAVYQIMLSVGLRPGELRALQWADVDWARSRLRVRRTVAKRAGGGVEVREGTKRGEERTVPLTLPVVAALRAWQRAGEGRWLFGGDGPLPNMTWTRAHRGLCQQAGVPVIRLHDLRHVCASLLLERGMPAKIVGDILGHRGIATTLDIYTHVSDDLMAQAAGSLSDWLNAGSCPAELPTEPETALGSRRRG